MMMNTTTCDAIGDRIMPIGGDTDDVRWALETAQAVLQRDPREALRWLRRAAETAAEEGLDLRAVQLANTAADLRAGLDLPLTTPPPREMDALADAPQADEQVTSSPALPHSYADPPRRFLDTDPGLSPNYDARTSSAPPPAPAEAAVAQPRIPPAAESKATLSALRVAVQRATDGSLLVSELVPGQPVPAHAHEALLVAVSPGVTL
jgi:hypothetical protein